MAANISKRMLALAAVGAAATLPNAPALADVKDGVDAWSRGDYSAAIKHWRGPAASGDADAQFNLAQAYKLGRGVKRDLAQAEKLYALAAARGHLQAADNLGLLLFQRGERAKAMPYVHAAADRGDPRAQYILGLAYFNGDNVPKDWIRAYALVSLAQQAGLPQAAGALSQMDQYVPLEDRQKSVNLASQLSAQAQATRQRQVAAADLGVTGPGSAAGRPSSQLKPFTPSSSVASAGQAPSPATGNSPATAGADYTLRPAPSRVPPVASIMESARPRPAPKPAPVVTPAPASRPAQVAYTGRAVAPVQRTSTSGNYRVQLGAFGVPGNADRLWNRVKNRPELAGHGKLKVPAGRVTKLQAGGFSTQGEAQAACNRLKAGGFDCIAVRK